MLEFLTTTVPNAIDCCGCLRAWFTIQPPKQTLKVMLWNIQDFGSGFGKFHIYPGEADLLANPQFIKAVAFRENGTPQINNELTQEVDEYLRWRSRLYDLATRIEQEKADVVVLLEMRTTARPNIVSSTLRAPYFYL